MGRQLVALFAVVCLFVLVGCNQDEGPNDPVVDGKKLQKQREDMLSPEEKAKHSIPSDGAPGSGGPANGMTK